MSDGFAKDRRVEDVGSEVGPSDSPAGRGLDSRPVLRSDQGLLIDPIRDGLLSEARSGIAGLLEILPDPFGQRRLRVAGSLDGTVQSIEAGSNVLIFHAGKGTRNLVRVNKNDCETAHKPPCIVPLMALAKKKPAGKVAKAPKPVKAVEVGPDGKTFGQRLHDEIRAKFGENQQSEFARLCSQRYQSAYPKVPDKVKQQHINAAIKTGQGSGKYLSLMAAVLEVRAEWLQYGIPPKEI